MIIEIAGHRFEIYTLVSKHHENVDLVLGIKNVFQLEGIIIRGNVVLAFSISHYQYFQRRK